MDEELTYKELFWIIIIIVTTIFITAFALSTPIDNKGQNTVEQIRYCHIDTITEYHNQLTPEITISYHTDCGFTINSNSEYKIGDSIPVKTIYFIK